MFERMHEFVKKAWTGLKRAVRFVVDVLLFIPRMVIKGFEILFDLEEEDEEEKINKLPPNQKKPETASSNKAEETKKEKEKVEEAEVKKQAEKIKENNKPVDLPFSNIANDCFYNAGQYKASGKVVVFPSKEEMEARNVASSDSNEKQSTFKFNVEETVIDNNLISQVKNEENDNIIDTVAEDNDTEVSDEVETVEGNVEENEKEEHDSSKVAEATEEELKMLYDINYRIVEHVNESPFPRQDYELLRSYDAIGNDLKKGNLGVTFTLRKASRDLIEALSFRGGYVCNQLCLDEDQRANDELRYLLAHNLISDEEHFVLNKRANSIILGTPSMIKTAEQQLMQMIDEYFYMFYPKCDPRNTLENIRARKKAAEANSAAA